MADAYGQMVATPGIQLLFLAIVVVLGMLVCSRGLQNGVEKINKAMMLCSAGALVVLAVRAVTPSRAIEGLKSPSGAQFPQPDVRRRGELPPVPCHLHDAMGQAFFTLSLGIGNMAIFGS